VAAFVILLAVVSLSVYFQYPAVWREPTSIGERAFVETDLSFSDALSVNGESRPICFGLVRGAQYKLVFVAEKFMSHVSSEMSINIHLPTEFTVVDGTLTWKGTDVRVVIPLRVVPEVSGDFIIEGTAINLELAFSSTSRIYGQVRASPEEARQACAITTSTRGSVTTITAIQPVSIVGRISDSDSHVLHVEADPAYVATLRFSTPDLEMWAGNHLGQRIMVIGYWESSQPHVFVVESMMSPDKQ
jgi:hypothetical protein